VTLTAAPTAKTGAATVIVSASTAANVQTSSVNLAVN